MDTTGIHFIDELDLNEKRVLIRVDFNVPLKDGKVTDDTRIRSALPTIVHALEAGAKVILCSHLGRPSGADDSRYSMEPVAARLAELLDTDTLLYDVEVLFPEHIVGPDVQELIGEMKSGKQVMLLDNLRFVPGEKAGDDGFAKELADLADVYINDAFGAAHRKHASVYQINKFFDRYHRGAGLLIKAEIQGLARLTQRPERPFVAIVGGAKVSDKLTVLQALIDKVDTILVGGAMAYTFLMTRDVGVGTSLVEEDYLDQATEILRKAQGKNVEILLPLDHRVAEKFDAAEARITEGAGIEPGWMGLDIGPKTVTAFAERIERAATIFWNGPLGVFENKAFSKGTFAVAEAVAAAPGFSVVGGGDSVAAITRAGLADQIGHVSTGGGASLQVVEGKSLPGIEGLRANHPFE